MSTAVKEIIGKVKTLNGKEKQELRHILPRILNVPQSTQGKIWSDREMARLAKLDQEALKTGRGLKTFKTKEAFIHHIRNI
ncbi:MAG: hypothetical protein HY747_05880 [Elusimicrobia bacterium]|nr:hypothetical protein [Elusimicrobiota bacterium]